MNKMNKNIPAQSYTNIGKILQKQNDKCSNRKINAMGSVDELASFIGLVCEHLINENQRVDIIDELKDVLERLFDIVIIIAGDLEQSMLPSDAVEVMGKRIDDMTLGFPHTLNFPLPFGSGLSASYINVCRSVCKRTEHDYAEFRNGRDDGGVGIWLNHTSDYLSRVSRVLATSQVVTTVITRTGYGEIMVDWVREIVEGIMKSTTDLINRIIK